jgi:hypothetical protein
MPGLRRCVPQRYDNRFNLKKVDATSASQLAAEPAVRSERFSLEVVLADDNLCLSNQPKLPIFFKILAGEAPTGLRLEILSQSNGGAG